MIKTLNKVGTEEMHFNIIKARYDKPTANYILSDCKLKAFSSKIRNETRMPTLTTYQKSCQTNQTRKTNKDVKIRDKEVKLSVFADDMTFYIENPKDSKKEKLELIKEVSKVAGYKINI